MTGRPGVGKTTAFSRTLDLLRLRGFRIAGFVCPEVREGGVRVGFKILDLSGRAHGWLAVSGERASTCSVRFGKYCLVEGDVARVVGSARASMASSDLVAVDEVGPMELRLEPSRIFIEEALYSPLPGIFVVHASLHRKVLSDLDAGGFMVKLYEVTHSNRSEIPGMASSDIAGFLAKRQRPQDP